MLKVLLDTVEFLYVACNNGYSELIVYKTIFTYSLINVLFFITHEIPGILFLHLIKI